MGGDEQARNVLDFCDEKARYNLEAVLVNAAKETASTTTQALEIYEDALEPAEIRQLERIRDEAKAIVEVPEEERSRAWAKDVIEGLSEVNATLDKMLAKRIRIQVEAEKVRKGRLTSKDLRFFLTVGATLMLAGWVQTWLRYLFYNVVILLIDRFWQWLRHIVLRLSGG